MQKVKRWLVLSPAVVFVLSLLVGTLVAQGINAEYRGGVMVGSAVTAVAAGVVVTVQRRYGRATVEYLEETERQVRLDALTGLLNRAGLMEALILALDRGRRENTCVGVIFTTSLIRSPLMSASRTP